MTQVKKEKNKVDYQEIPEKKKSMIKILNESSTK